MMVVNYKIISYICLLFLVITIACSPQIGKPSQSDMPKPVAGAENVTTHQSDNFSSSPRVDTQSQPAKPASLPKIVFCAMKGNQYEIYIMDPDGKNQVNLTNNLSNDFSPRLSPDGSEILFVSDRNWEPDNKTEDNFDIFVMDADGSNVRNITGHKAWDGMPCWSPDGSMILFCSWHYFSLPLYQHDMWVTDAEGKTFLNITPLKPSNTFAPTWPSWSPDGKKIIYNSEEEGTPDIYSMEIDSDQIKQIVLNPTANNYTGEEWSVTGNRKVVRPASTATNLSRDVPTKGIRKLTLDAIDYGDIGGWSLENLIKLTLNTTGYGYISWSPDGAKIVYVGRRKDVTTQIYDVNVMNSDGTNSVNLTRSPDWLIYNTWPSWSPDGNKIVFTSNRDGNIKQIYVMNADGSNLTKVTQNNSPCFSPTWKNVPYDLAEKIGKNPAP